MHPDMFRRKGGELFHAGSLPAVLSGEGLHWRHLGRGLVDPVRLWGGLLEQQESGDAIPVPHRWQRWRL